jgi:hypothetical protein
MDSMGGTQTVLQVRWEELDQSITEAAEPRTLKLVRDIAKREGRLSDRLWHRLFDHPSYGVLSEMDRREVDAAKKGKRKGLKLFLYMMLVVIGKRRKGTAPSPQIGWQGMVEKAESLLDA